MTKTFTGRVRGVVEWDYQSTGNDLSTPRDNPTPLDAAIAFTTGDGDNEVNVMYRARRTLSTASPTDLLDLAGGLTDQFGDTITFAHIKSILIYNRGRPDGAGDWEEVAGNDLLVGGAGAASGMPFDTPFGDDGDAVIRLPAGGVFVLSSPVDGFAVTAGTNDILRVYYDYSDASATEVEYDIVLFGVSA